MMIRFRRDSKGMFRFIFSILFILAIPIILSSLLSCRVSVEGDPHYQGSGPGPGPDRFIQRLRGNGFSMLTILQVGLNSTGLEMYGPAECWFDTVGRWEELTDIFLDSRTGQVAIRRPIGNQLYSRHPIG